MKSYLMILFALFFGLAMISCSDDSGVNVIDVGNGDEEPDENGDDEEEGTVYSITFGIDGGGEFTFSVDMEGATIEGDDLPDDFEGDVLTFDPEVHKVFIAGSMVDWPQPGTDTALELSTSGTNGGTVEAGEAQFKFFIVPPGVENDDGVNASWNYGEWEGEPDREYEIVAGETGTFVWGNKPEVEEPDEEAFEELYMIGASVGSWDWAEVDLPMIPVAEKPNLFWKIVWIESGVEDAGFKFAPEQDWGNDFGWNGEDPENEIFGFGSQNMPEPDETGYYMVVVNTDTEEIAVTAPQVYLIGDTIGSWDQEAEGAIFDVDNDNEIITITKDLASAELRMYSWFDKGWFTDWWQSEFMIFDGEIEFRGAGGDQERVNLEADGEYTIDLNFRSGEGSITFND